MTPFTALKNFSPFHFISLYIYFLLFFFTYPINPSLHFTLLFPSTTHISSLPLPSLFTFYRLHFPHCFLTLVLKIGVLPWEVPIAHSGIIGLVLLAALWAGRRNNPLAASTSCSSVQGLSRPVQGCTFTFTFIVTLCGLGRCLKSSRQLTQLIMSLLNH